MTVWLARPEQPPAGVPVAVKDLLDTAGLVTTYGSILFADHVPARSAEAVPGSRRQATASQARRTCTSSRTGSRRRTRTSARCRTRVTPDGSRAARAAARRQRSPPVDVELALGTDSGGSIRIPAAWCGIAGFKPTYGLVPADGCFPLAPSYDHVGPMASTVAGCAVLCGRSRPASSR